MHDHCTAPDPDPVRALLFDAAEALATALGETDPARRAAHLADLARLTAAAQAANAVLLQGTVIHPGNIPPVSER